jgi:prolyl-tRNA synthetase
VSIEKKMSKKLPDIKTNFSEWYNEIVYKAELADQAPVRGCIVIRPYGWSIWENIKSILDQRIKETGHQNCAFPMLIPESFIKREASHIEGFSPELAIVTHAGGKKLEEPLVIRPTSETIVHHMFAQWIKSWRDLPVKVNQWCSVIRWEMRVRPFLRTSEFFWQEGHTAHATYEEAQAEAKMMMDEYVKLAQDYLAIPVMVGIKSDSEKFAGADTTYTYEAFMQDGKALQMGTSHLLSRNFAKIFEIQYQDQAGKLVHPYLTSWCGATTRLIGAIIAVHGDQAGLVIPPKIAPIQAVVVPILKTGSEQLVNDFAATVVHKLKSVGVRVHLDDRDNIRPGAKFYEWELKGIPLRIEMGPRDIEKNQVVIADRLSSQKEFVLFDELANFVDKKLADIQDEMFASAKAKQLAMKFVGEKLVKFGPKLEKEAGFYQTGWCLDENCEQELKKYKATTRCLLETKELATCFACDEPSKSDVIVAKSY